MYKITHNVSKKNCYIQNKEVISTCKMSVHNGAGPTEIG